MSVDFIPWRTTANHYERFSVIVGTTYTIFYTRRMRQVTDVYERLRATHLTTEIGLEHFESSAIRKVLQGTKKGRAPMSALPTENSEVFRYPTHLGRLDDMRSAIQMMTCYEIQTTVQDPIGSIGEGPSLMRPEMNLLLTRVIHATLRDVENRVKP